jgi:hypothetical protein
MIEEYKSCRKDKFYRIIEGFNRFRVETTDIGKFYLSRFESGKDDYFSVSRIENYVVYSEGESEVVVNVVDEEDISIILRDERGDRLVISGFSVGMHSTLLSHLGFCVKKRCNFFVVKESFCLKRDDSTDFYKGVKLNTFIILKTEGGYTVSARLEDVDRVESLIVDMFNKWDTNNYENEKK